jgi:hypothetical protein
MQAVALLQRAGLTTVEGPAREFADAIYVGAPLALVWNATRKRRAANCRGGLDRLQQLRWAVERRCLGCGAPFAESHGYGARAEVLCHTCGQSEPSDRLRRGVAEYVLEVADAFALDDPDDATPLSDEEADEYRRLVIATRAALDAAEPDEHGAKRVS